MIRYNKVIFFMFFLLCSFLLFYTIKLVDSAGIKITFLVRSFLIIINLFLLLRLLYLYVIKDSLLKNIYRNILFFISSIIIIFLLLEFVFMFIPYSHGFQSALGSRVWYFYYWRPVNRLGYRDREITLDYNKKSILVVGDSFVAGCGIKNSRDRFPDLLEAILPGFKVFNLGSNGQDTQGEYKNLIEYPVRPNIIVLQYFGNDIDCPQSYRSIKIYSDLNRIVAYAVKFSFFFNYTYWQFPHYDYKDYFNTLASCYEDEQILSRHLSNLDKFIEYSKEKNIPLIVVLFPFMNDIEFSRIYTEAIESYLREREIRVLNVTDLVKGLSLKKRIVNFNDPHPGPLVNKIVAKELSKIIKTL